MKSKELSELETRIDSLESLIHTFISAQQELNGVLTDKIAEASHPRELEIEIDTLEEERERRKQNYDRYVLNLLMGKRPFARGRNDER